MERSYAWASNVQNLSHLDGSFHEKTFDGLLLGNAQRARITLASPDAAERVVDSNNIVSLRAEYPRYE
jgi:hypothetical protein